MTTQAGTRERDAGYQEMLRTLSEGSVHVHFDPYEDIAWDSPELAIDPADPRWVLSPTHDPLGATAWYQGLPQERQVEIGTARMMNAMKVGAAFESMLIRGLMQYVVALPNGSPEFRYCLHEMTEECNHIQMFQELVNRVGADVPGMRRRLRLASPFIGGVLAALPVALMVSILAGEEPIDHYQKSLLREGGDVPPAVLRTMEIHIAEEARHISFAHEFVKLHVPRLGRANRFALSLYFPLAMRIACEEIMTPPGSLAKRLEIPRDVFEQAFWRSPVSRRIMASYFGDMRALAEEVGLINRASRRLWQRLGIDGERSRYRGEPDRRAELLA
ncbi:diiron oxygenase [Conexibacter sp. JD483]|uniref:AurF N-oxygenase family protein n=1 Tax=unclassified Conexibacter TaxID=2627773 RepID=UPI002722F5AA|nr:MULTISPECIES: diiron oxygenase [unclassified Conexibacter]MDO8188634.1 diiron oxygenase [Conexibacter sp. CPCC 205706]MDO8201530.1 diiron oxygenase [Conexibacter sp. CPCC 205762]MDR9370749.1 diiron oxygenase [Conexibacter sp. JD483]